MFKDMLRTSKDVTSAQISVVPNIFLIIAAMIVLTLAYAVIVPGAPANLHSFSFFDQFGKDREDAAKKKIMGWMAENSAMPDHILSEIYDAAVITGNRDLILAICFVESNFNPHVKSDKGAIGLMGIMPGIWAKELKERGIINEKEDLFKISGNIAAGAHVLAAYLSGTDDLRLALIRYVGGASWYATKVFQAQKQIRLAQYPNRQRASADGLN